MKRQWNDKIFDANLDFEALAIEIFQFQYNNNTVYRQYVDAIGVDPLTVGHVKNIPFLPIRFFKTHPVHTTLFEPEARFESSGTTETINSRHLVRSLSIYRESFTRGFEIFYGPVKDWCFIGLLPSYLQRQNSSLVYVVNDLINQSGHPLGGFYLDEYDKLRTTLTKLESQKQKTFLIGVTFGLLDFAESGNTALPNTSHTTIIETGGMKGRRREIIRQEVHDQLKATWNIQDIHSEYGMTELLSQAWSQGKGIFHCPPWMKILLRDDEDPFELIQPGSENTRMGAINVIDLANIFSCSFIATDDAGKLYPDGGFEVLGRIDNSDLRGCSLLTV